MKKQDKDINKKNQEQGLIDYSKIGAQLKLVRERKGLSLDQVFEITRIQTSILQGIEEGKSLVAPVFLKGFIKNYARFLGLDSEKLFEKKKPQSKKKEDSQVKESFIAGPAEKSDKKEEKKIQYLLISTGLVLVFLILYLKFVSSNVEEKNNKISVIEEIAETQQAEIQTEQGEKELLKENSSAKRSSSFFDQIKKSVFKEELLIRSPESLQIYFKVDKGFNITKALEPMTWFQIKARESIYLRFDENKDGIQLFYNGKQVNLGDELFFEKTFQR